MTSLPPRAFSRSKNQAEIIKYQIFKVFDVHIEPYQTRKSGRWKDRHYALGSKPVSKASLKIKPYRLPNVRNDRTTSVTYAFSLPVFFATSVCLGGLCEGVGG